MGLGRIVVDVDSSSVLLRDMTTIKVSTISEVTVSSNSEGVIGKVISD